MKKALKPNQVAPVDRMGNTDQRQTMQTSVEVCSWMSRIISSLPFAGDSAE